MESEDERMTIAYMKMHPKDVSASRRFEDVTNLMIDGDLEKAISEYTPVAIRRKMAWEYKELGHARTMKSRECKRALKHLDEDIEYREFLYMEDEMRNVEEGLIEFAQEEIIEKEKAEKEEFVKELKRKIGWTPDEGEQMLIGRAMDYWEKKSKKKDLFWNKMERFFYINENTREFCDSKLPSHSAVPNSPIPMEDCEENKQV
jgi:hypothetical protein